MKSPEGQKSSGDIKIDIKEERIGRHG